MKAIISLLLSLALTLNATPHKVLAQKESLGYSRVLTTDTAFYSDMAGRNLKFYLPYGYYVKIEEIGATYTKVSYMFENSHFPFLTGYIKTLDLIPKEVTPVSPFPLLSLTVCSDDVLFADSYLQNSKVAVYADSLAVYYGEITQNQEELVYVFCNGYLGYMRKNCFAPYIVPPHPEPIETPNISQNSSSSNSKIKTNNLQIFIVAGISVIVVSFVYFIFKPNGKRIKENYYEE